MKVFKPGFICKIDDGKKALLPDEREGTGKILKTGSVKGRQVPLFFCLRCEDIAFESISQFEYDESVINYETFYSFTLPTPSDFNHSVLYTPKNFSTFVWTYTYKSRSDLIYSISKIIQKSLIPQLQELKNQKTHTEFTASKFQKTQKNYLRQKTNIEVNLRAEYNLLKEKEKLMELIRSNRPFLNVGFTGVKSSKHVVCVEKQKKKEIGNKIEEKTHALEIQLGMATSIWEKNLKSLCFKALRVVTTYLQSVQVLVRKSNINSLTPIVFYTFSAWISFTKLKKEKKTCVVLAKSALNLFRLVKIFKSWKEVADRPKKVQKFISDVKDYMYLRKLSRLLISWRWHKSYQKLKSSMKLLSYKLYKEKLKIKKFFELKTEICLIRGSRFRYQSLAKGEESEFDKETLIRESRFQYNQALRRLISSLSNYKQEIFLQAQDSLYVQSLICRSEFYSRGCMNWTMFLKNKYKNN